MSDSILMTALIIFITAVSEEAVKAGLVYITKGTYFIILAVLAFPIWEFYLYYNDVYYHTLDLGAPETYATLLTLLFLTGAKLLHIFTSLFYLYSKNIILYILFGSIIHFLYNLVAEFTPPLPLKQYLVFPWILAIGVALSLWLFHRYSIKKGW